MAQATDAEHYLALTEQLLSAAKTADWSTASHLLDRREQLVPKLKADLRKQILEMDRQTMVLLSTESNQLKQKLDRIDKGIRTLRRYASGFDSRGKRFDLNAE